MKKVDSQAESSYKQKVAVLKMQVALLKQDLANIQTATLKRIVLNEIFQKEASVANATKKYIARTAIQPPPVQEALKERVPRVTKKRLTKTAVV